MLCDVCVKSGKVSYQVVVRRAVAGIVVGGENSLEGDMGG